jgi:hypothetical protein
MAPSSKYPPEDLAVADIEGIGISGAYGYRRVEDIEGLRISEG